MAPPTKKGDSIDLLYPDLLSKEGLLHNLKKRYIKISTPDLEALDKESLVDLYNRYILPLPQRKYRDNLRGTDMKRKQIVRDKKRKFMLSDNSDLVSPNKKGKVSQDSSASPSSGLVNHFAASSRLKPPPSCIDTSKKVVKLSSSTSQSTTKPEESELGSNSKPSETEVKLDDENMSHDPAVKRQANGDKDDETSSKKKFKPIKWP